MNHSVSHIKNLNELHPQVFTDLIDKKWDALVLNALVPLEQNEFYLGLKERMSSCSKNVIQHQNLSVYPLSYALIHEKNDAAASEHLLQLFFEEAQKANQNYERLVGKNSIDTIQKLLQILCNYKLDVLGSLEQEFPKFNIRSMLPQEQYAIEIHCENSFIHQLNPKLRAYLNQQVYLEEALSFYTVLQAPDAGGQLLLFNKEWSQFQVASAALPETVRKNEDLFFKDTPHEHTKISLQAGDMVIFRAAQIWHCISEIQGSKARITLGGFIAKSKTEENKYYFWS